jgi:plastocyanin
MEPTTPQSSSKGLVVGIIIFVIIILVGGYIYMRRQPVSPPDVMENLPVVPAASSTPSATLPKTVTVTYDGTSFSPATVTINKGDTVKFTNNSTTTKMWVASAPHPTHTDYPGFDRKAALSQGQSYSFTFTKVGSWKYHNHVKPTSYGTVVVK